MTWVAVAVGGAAIVGGVISSQGAKSAAGTQAQSAQNSLQLQENMYNQTVSNEAPFLKGGQGALSALNYGLGIGKPGADGTGSSLGNGGSFGSLNAPFTVGDFHKYSPAYQFQLQQGQQGTLNQDSSAQGAESGAALKDLTSFNQNYANTAFGNAFQQYQAQQSNVFNRLAGLAQMGQGAASNQATGGSSFASGIGQSATNVGTAVAAGQIGQANAAAGAINSAMPWLYQGINASPNQPISDAGQGLATYCDYALKDGIEPYLFDGQSQLQVYEFSYRGSSKRWLGMIAQEVLEKYPNAVSRGPHGYLMVDYSLIPTDHHYPMKLTEFDWDEVDHA